jgi:hypothetical protein
LPSDPRRRARWNGTQQADERPQLHGRQGRHLARQQERATPAANHKESLVHHHKSLQHPGQGALGHGQPSAARPSTATALTIRSTGRLSRKLGVQQPSQERCREPALGDRVRCRRSRPSATPTHSLPDLPAVRRRRKTPPRRWTSRTPHQTPIPANTQAAHTLPEPWSGTPRRVNLSTPKTPPHEPHVAPASLSPPIGVQHARPGRHGPTPCHDPHSCRRRSPTS